MDKELKIIINGVRNRDIKYLPYSSQTLEDVVNEIPIIKEGYDIVVNGKMIPESDRITTPVFPTDKITCVPNFGDPVSIATVASFIAGGATAGVIYTLAYIAVSAAVSIGVGYLIQALSGKPKTPDERTSSQAFSWDPRTTQQQGDVKPLIFGKFKSYGNIVGAYVNVDPVDDTKLRMNALVAHGTGPVKSLSDHRINNQPSSSFPDLTIETRRGLLDQTPISFFNKLRIQYRPNIVITHTGGALTWVVPDNDYDDLEIILNMKVWYYHKSGGAGATSMSVKVEIEETDSDSWTTIFNDAITNSGTETFYKSLKMSDYGYTIENGKQYTVRVTKESADTTGQTRVGHDLVFEFVTEISDDALEYPGTVLVGYSGLLKREFQGLQKNSSIIEGQIVEQWNGSSWVLDHTDNPAWVAGYALSKPVISGDGDTTPYAVEKYEGMSNNRIDWDDLYDLSLHCNTLVPDGKGDIEKLITFNGIFDTDIDMWHAVCDIVKIARANPVWQGNKVTFIIDKAGSRVDILSVGNISDGSWDETILPVKDRVADIDASYVDASNNYEKALLRTFSSKMSSHSNKMSLDFRGIAKKTEAWRLAKYHTAYNELIKRQLTVTADIDALGYRVGDVIGCQHFRPNWNQLEHGHTGSGSVVELYPDAGGDVIELDTDIEDALTIGTTYQILIRTAENVQVTKTIASVSGNRVTIVGQYSSDAPAEKDLWVIGKQNEVVKDFRVIKIRRSSNQEFLLDLLEYDSDLYDYDSVSPSLPYISSTPAKSDKLIRPPTLDDINRQIPQVALDGPIYGELATSNLVWVDNSSSGGFVGWEAEDEETPILVIYKGVTYEIDSDETDDDYIFFDPDTSETEFQTTDDKDDLYGFWLLCFNKNGVAFDYPMRVLDGHVIDDDSITTPNIEDNAVTDSASFYAEGISPLALLTWSTMAQITFTTKGGPVFIQASAIITADGGDNHAKWTLFRRPYPYNPPPYAQGLIEGQGWVEITDGYATSIAIVYKDTPAAGSYTYQLRGQKDTNGMAACYCYNRSITVQELKK